jgi:small-conductance mechanosensitive channel
MKRKAFLVSIPLVLGLLALLSAGMNVTLADTPEPASSPVSTAQVETATQEPTAVDSTEGETGTSEDSGPLDEVVSTRTPMPTATPGFLAEEVSRIARERGLAGETYLGLTVEDWINLGVSLLIVLAGYLIGSWLIRHVLRRLVKRTTTKIDDRLLEASGPEVRWLVVILVLQFATVRLTFVNASLKIVLSDIYFVAGLSIAVRIVWHLIDLLNEEAMLRSTKAGRGDELAPLVTLLARLGRVVIAVIGIAILLSHFGVDVLVLAAALGVGGLALSLAAKDTVADAIAGFIVLVDQPYRIGDRIEIKGLGTWGDVVDIGLRTTRIRTRDNRMVIVPNSTIGTNEVINYSYPDPQYRIQTHVGVAYGTDNDTVEAVIVDAVRQVEGVLRDKPVDALYVEMGDYAMIYRVRWWIESYVDTRRMYHRVHRSLQKALDEAGIESPFPTQSLNLQVEPETVEHLSLASEKSNRHSPKDRQ